MTELHIMRPEWLWTLVPALLLAALLWRLRKRQGNWHTVIAPELLQHLVGKQATGRQTNLLPVLLVGWIVAAVAASGPSFKKIPQPIHQKQDAMVLVLDLSYSMKSQDLAPSRLDRARQKLLDLLAQRKEGQTGLVAFAGDAHIVTPLTDDVPTIANLLPALHPDMMPVAGSDAAAGIAMAVDLLRSAGMREGKILLVTDGVSDRYARAIARLVADTSVQLTVMGVGTESGAPIPLPRGGFLKDDSGTIVMPGLDTAALADLAAASGGTYTPMRIDDADIDRLLQDNPLLESRDTLALDRTADTWEDQGYLLILLLMPLALALFRRGWVLGLAPLVLLLPVERSYANAWDDLWLTPDQQGQRALQSGDSASAAELFDSPAWAGTAAFREGDYERAIEHFSSGDSADSWYNRGNALARSGQLEQAIAAYTESLVREPEREDALHNRALVEELLKQQQQQQQQQQEQQSEQDESEQAPQDGQQGQSGDQQQDPQQGQSQQETSPEQQGDPRDSEESGQDNQQAQGNDAESGDEEREAAEAQDREGDQGEQAQARAAQSAQDQERDQAMEQWLRRVPDDPSGLLREKFRYESRKRQEQGLRIDEDNAW